ncbi:MAG: GNAT family N-acetyltransferase [Steroidobacteraceae bacterium]
MTDLVTPRLLLRQWSAGDLEPFAALNADPVAMRFMPRCLTRAESDALARAAQEEIARRGWGLWACELRENGDLIGCIGLGVPSFEAYFSPCVAIDWRLGRASWGRGFATEAADDFDHPRVDAGHPLRRHVLYRVARDAWQRATSDMAPP